jgi:hypothetical protein
MPDNQTFFYVDGGRVKHRALIEPCDGGADTLVLDVLGKPHRVPIRLYPDGEGAPAMGGLARRVDTSLAMVCYALLHAFMNVWRLQYGAKVAFELNSRRLIARYQEHPPDRGIGRPHPGVTVFEDISAAAQPPGGEPAPGSNPAPGGDPGPGSGAVFSIEPVLSGEPPLRSEPVLSSEPPLRSEPSSGGGTDP